MSTKHTRGPWTISHTNRENQLEPFSTIIGARGTAFSGEGARCIADVLWNEDREANAYLIAQAPRMFDDLQGAEARLAQALDALCSMRQLVSDRWPTTGIDDEAQAVFEQAQAELEAPKRDAAAMARASVTDLAIRFAGVYDLAAGLRRVRAHQECERESRLTDFARSEKPFQEKPCWKNYRTVVGSVEDPENALAPIDEWCEPCRIRQSYHQQLRAATRLRGALLRSLIRTARKADGWEESLQPSEASDIAAAIEDVPVVRMGKA